MPGITEARAIQIAGDMTEPPAGLSQAAAAADASATEMTYSAAAALLNEGANQQVPSGTQVWVVTIPGTLGVMSAPAGVNVTMPSGPTTIIIDAANGNPIDSCVGCKVAASSS